MLRAHRVSDVRTAEAALMGSVPPGTLMARAALGLATVCAGLLHGPYGHRVVLLVGGGDNGGDALYAGATLARRGALVQAVLLSPRRTHPGGLASLLSAGGQVQVADGLGGTDAALTMVRRADLVLDGIVGIGGTPGLRPPADRLADAAAEHVAPVVAVDLPSGIGVDDGQLAGSAVRADLTVTFGTHKVGQLVDPAAALSGQVQLVEIGLDPWLPAPAATALQDGDVDAMLPSPQRTSDKYERGVLGIHAGSSAYAGAAVLAVGGALRGGVGMVRMPAEGQDELQVLAAVRARWPEVVGAPGRVQAWVVGPGVAPLAAGSGVAVALSSGLPAVLDAGALDVVADMPAGELGPDVLLTPHAGELARMLGVSRERVESERLEHAGRAARRWGATVLLKGSTTVVVDADGRARVNRSGTPWLATAGSGDVLAGLAGALLAGGLDAMAAGSLAAYLHGRAGEVAAMRCGRPSAQDVVLALGEVMRRPGTRGPGILVP